MSNTSIATEYTPFQYLLIAIANAAGEDKLLFEDRIEWTLSNAKNLHKLINTVDEKPLFIRGIQELDNIRKGINTGFMVGLDGTASGLQCLASLSGCIKTATNVGLVIPNKRCDVYTASVDEMNYFLHPSNRIQLKSSANYDGLTRNDIKTALMTHYYASRNEPKKIFGAATPELKAFYRALLKMNPGAEDLMQDFMNCIDNRPVSEGGRIAYWWDMPDGFEVRCNVIASREVKVEIDELDNKSGNKSTLTHLQKFIGTNDKYVALPANATHSCDSLLVREMHRRMNHNKANLAKAKILVEGAKIDNRDEFVSLRMADWMLEGRTDFSESQAGQLNELIEMVTQFDKAPMASIHDEFKTYPANCGQMRYHYREILAEIADSELVTHMLRDMYQDQTLQFTKHSEGNELSSLIRKSKYAIC